MASYNRTDLEFILQQIKLSEAHASGETALTDLIPNPLLPWGVRTVDGTLNNIVPGREEWGSSLEEFPRLTEVSDREGTAPTSPFSPGGPFPITNTDYSLTSSVVDTAPRTISNLIVDQTLNNPAAILAALKFAGIVDADATVALAKIRDAFAAVKDPAEAVARAEADVALAQTQLALAQATQSSTAVVHPFHQITADAYANAIPQIALAKDAIANSQSLLVDMMAGGLGAVGTTIDAGHVALMGDLVAAANSARLAAIAARDALNPAGVDFVLTTDLSAAQALVTAANQLFNTATALSTNNPEGSTTVAGDVTRFNNAVDRATTANTDVIALDQTLAVSNVLAVANAEAATAAADAVVLAQAALDEAQANLGDPASLAQSILDGVLEDYAIEITANGSLVIPNVAPDEGISAPFNSWMTLFGQFFDHGLDLVEKTAGTRVYVPLQPDDPLYVEGGTSNFMVITRTTEDARNLTTPFVDQNQTYTSHASHQVFLREYAKIADGNDANANPDVVATGHLLEGGSGGLATWADVKAQSIEMLGLQLDDRHVHEVPLLATDLYGMFERAPNGYAMVIVTVALSNGETVTARASGKDGGLDLLNITEADLVDFTAPDGATINGIATIATGHAFLDDIAHTAAPALVDPDRNPFTDNSIWTSADDNDTVGNRFDDQVVNDLGVRLTYDNELLDRHFVTGDGRGNENIGLTAVHHVFHSEHNRMVEHTKDVVLATGDVAFLNEWLLEPVTEIPTDPSTLEWNGERLFQAARFGTEMQYQHLVFEEFARKVNPMVDVFVFNPTMDINPAIFAEFAHVVYRFGHSMLNEDVDRLGADGQTADDIGLIEAFLNPVEYDKDGSLSPDEAAGAIVRGMTRQQGNAIDEFITDALRNNLLGLPLDLAAINLARGRETGMPTLNEAREQFFEGTRSEWLRPYENWVDFAQNLKNPASIINFIAAYGTHESITSVSAFEDKRDAATLLVLGGEGAPTDRLDFLNGTNAYADLGGLNDVDLWIGGLAESILPFGGMLGSTFTFVFEMQMENLQNGDRFYYLSRTQGLNFLTELENNSFSKIIIRNTDLGEPGATHLPGEIFATPQHILEVNQDIQNQPDPTHDDPVLESIQEKVVRRTDVEIDNHVYANYLKFTGGEHVVLGGTDQDDVLIGDFGDDSIWGDGGDDLIIGGHGINRLHGGAGDDIIFGGGDPEFLHGEDGNDVIHGGNGLGDLIFGGKGQDFIIGGIDGKEVFGGEGNDFILGSPDVDFLLGGEGDDWIEGGEGFDTIAGDNSELFFNSSVIGHDVMFAGTNENDFDAESGDDIMVQGESVMRNEGMLGFDWVTFQEHKNFGVTVDMNVKIFTTVFEDILRNRFDRVEALSGSSFGDTIIGDSREAAGGPINPAIPVNEQTLEGDELNTAGVERIAGLHRILGFDTVADLRAAFPNDGDTVFNAGNILLGNGGSDIIEGRGGNDIIDGDSALQVRIGIVNQDGAEIGTAFQMQGAVHFYTTEEAAALNAAADALGQPKAHAAASAELLAREGQPLDQFMFDRGLNPGDLRIVREIIDGGQAGDIDVASFRGNQSEYTITELADGTLQVAHVTPSDAQVDDGTDILRNIELLRFADGIVNIAGIANNVATGALEIEFVTDNFGQDVINTGDVIRVAANPDGTPVGIADTDGVPNIAAFTFAWQVAEVDEVTGALGPWQALLDPITEVPVTGRSLTILEGFEIAGQVLRAVGSFNDANGFPEFVFSAPTAPVVGNAPVVPDPAFENTTDEDAAIIVTAAQLLTNAVDPNGDQMFITDIAIRLRDDRPFPGTLTEVRDANGFLQSVTFTPEPDFNGEVIIEYTITDGVNATPGAEWALTVLPVNDAPVPAPLPLGVVNAGAPQTLTFTEALLFGNILRDENGDPTDVDGDPVEILAGSVVLANPAQGTLTDNLDGTFTFVPAAGVSGDVAVNFTLTDGTVDVASSTSLAVGRTLNGTGAGNTLDGTNAGDVINGLGGNDTINGLSGNDTIAGGTGNDTINGGAGDDTITWSVTNPFFIIPAFPDGRDIIDGGEGNDTFIVNGNNQAETYRIYERTAWLDVTGNTAGQLNAGTEIVVTRNGTSNASVIAELRGIEEIIINTGPGNDTVLSIGDFSPTSLSFNTITINGGIGNDVIDISGLMSAHRVVFASNGGDDTIIGNLRPQDIIELAPGVLADVYVETTSDGMTTRAFGTSGSITFTAGLTPTIVNGVGVTEQHPAADDAFSYTAADLAALKNLVNGIPLGREDDDDLFTGIRDLEGTGNNQANPDWGSADQPFIRLTEARYGGGLGEDGLPKINPIFAGLDPRTISNILGQQEDGLAKATSGANIFFMAFGQYVDHGLDFLPKFDNKTLPIGVGDEEGVADLNRGIVTYDADGNPLHTNKVSPFIDQNQAYGSTELVGQFLRESDGNQGFGAKLFAGGVDPSNTDFRLLPTLRELIHHHWQNDTIFVFDDGTTQSFRDYYTEQNEFGDVPLVDDQGNINEVIARGLNADFMGSTHTLVGDANPFVDILDHYVGGDLRANENYTLTSIHTIWARNHNYHVDKLLAAGFEGTEEELFQAAKIVNEAEYQRVVFTEFADHLLGGMRGSGDHGHDEYDPNADASISHEFAGAAYRFGHSLIGQTLSILDDNGQLKQVPLFDAFLNPTNAEDAFTRPLSELNGFGYFPQEGFEQIGVNNIIGGIIQQQAEEVDFNIVDAVRDDLVRIRADLFAFNVARGWDLGLGTLNQVRKGLSTSTDPYVSEAVELSDADLSAYTSWEDFQSRNGLSDDVIAQFKEAYPDLIIEAGEVDAFKAVNPDIDVEILESGSGRVKGIDRVDLWVGGLAETHINDGVVGATFWVIIHEQLDRLQQGDRFYYLDRVGDLEFYENLKELKFSEIIARNTGLEGLPNDIFEADEIDIDDNPTGDDVVVGGDGDDDIADDDDADDDDDDAVDDDMVDSGDGDADDDDGIADNDDAPVVGPAPPAPAVVLVGTAASDALFGGAAGDTISGGDGDDVISAGDGDDVLFGEAGADKIVAGAGNDIVFGGAGDDVLLGGDGDDWLDGGTGNDTIDAGKGNDRIIASRFDGDDVIDGGEGNDTYDMSAITDGITVDLGWLGFGSAVSDQLGNDTLRNIENVVTGAGQDTLIAGAGVNVLAGGLGDDTFVFRSAASANGDTIADFHSGDRIDLSAITASFGGGSQELTFGGNQATLSASGQVIFRHEQREDGNEYTVLEADVDGDVQADFKINIAGRHNLTNSDFNF